MSRVERNPQETQKKILDAATEEFKEHGPHGARIDQIISKAGVNKRMIYHYFNDKAGLFEAVMKREIEEINGILAESPRKSPFDDMRYWHSKNQELDSFLKLCCWVDSNRDDDVVAQNEREDIFKQSAEVYRQMQKDGKIPKGIDPKFFLLAVMSISAFPMVVPKLAKIVTGHEFESDEFEKKYMKVIKKLLDFE